MPNSEDLFRLLRGLRVKLSCSDGDERCGRWATTLHRGPITRTCKEGSDPAKAGIRYISEITIARLLRAGQALSKKVSGQRMLTNTHEFDSGLRVLKIDTSNMRDIYYAPDTVQQGDLARPS